MNDLEINANIRKAIIEIRKSHKYTQAEFGKLFDVSKTGVSSWESGHCMPSPEMLYKIAKRFDVPLSYMYGETEKIEIEKKPSNEDIQARLNAYAGYTQMWVSEGEKRLLEELRDRDKVIDEKILEEMFNKILRYKQDNNSPIDVECPMYYEIRLSQFLKK